MEPPEGDPLVEFLTACEFAHSEELSRASGSSHTGDTSLGIVGRRLTQPHVGRASTYATSEDESLHRAEMDFLSYQRATFVQQQRQQL